MKNFYKLLFFLIFLFNIEFIIAKPTFFLIPDLKKLVLPSATISNDGSASACIASATQPKVKFTGSGGTAPYTFVYKINNGANLTVVTTSGDFVLVNQSTTVAGSFVFTLVSVKDATNVPQTISVPDVTVIINPKPVISFSSNATNTTCSDVLIQFNSTVTVGTAPFTYAWDFDDGSFSTIQNPSHVFNGPNTLGCNTFTFNVKLTITDVYGCISTQFSQNVIVKQRPNFEVNDSSHPFSQFDNCSNASASSPSYNVILSNNLSIASACITSYSINWGDNSATITNVAFPISHTYAQLGAYNLVVTAFGTNGCSNSKTYVVKNVSNPSGGISSPGNTQNLCSPTTDLQFGISNWGINSPGTVYQINYGDNSPIATLTQETLVASSFYNASNPASSTNYPIPHIYTQTSCPVSQLLVTLIVTNACGSTPFTTSNISILSKPVANFTNPPTGCVNTSVLFTNTTIEGYSQNCAQSAIYTWDFGDGSPIITTPMQSVQNINHVFSIAGNYSITITAANYCGSTTKTKTICIEPALTIPAITLTPTNANHCVPLIVNATTPTPSSNCSTPVQYLWTVTHTDLDCDVLATDPTYLNSSTSTSQNPTFNFTNPGSYSIRLKMTNSCGIVQSAIQTLTVKKPPRVTVNAIANLCGGNAGTTTINPTANVQNCGFTNAELVYNWSFTGATTTTSNLIAPQVTYSAGGSKTVSLSISVAGGCANSLVSSQTFGIGTAPTLTPLSPATQTICSGSTTTALALTAQNGTTFSWSATTIPVGVNVNPSSGNLNSIPSLTINNSTNASKTVTLTITSTLDGCSSTNFYDIIINPGPTLTQPVGSTICSGGTVTPLSVTVSPSPANGTATYKWYSNTTGNNNITSSTLVNTSSIDGNYTPPATPGTIYYFCEVTFSSSGSCPGIKSNAVAVIVNSGATINPQPVQTQKICVGSTIATPLISDYSGGTGIAVYQWYKNTTDSNSGGTLIAGATNSSYFPPVFSVPETVYFYLVVSFSGNGCGAIACDPAEIKVFSDPIITSILPATQTLCSGVTPTNLTVTATGEVALGNLAYQWFSNSSNSNANGNLISGATNTTYTPSTNIAGTTFYYCEVSQNGLGCSTKSNTVSVTVNLAATITQQPQSSTICLGATPTVLNVAFSNGVGTPQYQWFSNSTNTIAGSTPIAGATNASFAPSGANVGTVFYYCKITLSGGGCSELISNIAEVTINQNPVIGNKNVVICSGNAFNITPANAGSEIVPAGTTFTWSNPVVNPVNSITGANAVNSPQTSIGQVLTNSTTNPATATYNVTPISGICSGTNFYVTVTVNPAISANVIVNNSTCFGINNGSIQTNIVGGIPFSSGSPYQIAWTGPNGFTSTATSILNLAPGNYNLTVTDAGGCPFSNNYMITEPNDLLITNDLEKDITCFNDADGEIKISIAGGTLNYTYFWTKDGNPFATTEDIANLSPGEYIVTVSDANNCGPKTLTFNITQPPILALNLLSQTNILCFGDSTGAININASGGTPIEITPGVFNYVYAWTGPNGFTSTNQNLNGILAGTYNLIITDNSGCTKNISVTITQTPEIIINATITAIVCDGDNDATISVSISGGNPPYNVSWSNFAQGLFLDNLSPGDYLITVIDAMNCIKTLNINIPQPPFFRVTPIKKDISCFGANDGSIQLNFVGGLAPISFAWADNPNAGTDRNNLPAGTYTVNISDSKPCYISRTFTILEPQELILSANVTNAFDCNDANSGNINLLVAGGSAPFTYSWSNGATTEDLIKIPAGNYQVTVTDLNGCSKTAQYAINRQPPIVINVITNTDFDCVTKYVKQTFEAQVSGGVPPFQLIWSSGTVSGANNELMNTNQNGTVILKATDSFGCFQNYSFNVAIPTLGDPVFTSTSYAFATYGSYSMQDPIQFTNNSSGDFVSIVWDFGDGSVSNELNPTHLYVKEGIYIVTQTVTYPFGCVYVFTTTLVVNKGYELIVPTAFTPNDDAVNDYFTPVSKGLQSIELNVYDTWGELIFSENGATIKGWNGKMKNVNSENGNYYFKVTAQTFYGDIINKNGPFTLLK